MKTRKQKVISRIFCTIVSILLLASFFVVPVSAADGAFYKFRPNFDFETINSSYFFMQGNNSVNMDWLDNMVQLFSFEKITPNDWDGEWASFEFKPNQNYQYTGLVMPLGISSLSSDGSSVTMTSLDTIYLDAGRFYAEMETEQDALIKARFTIRPVYNVLPNGNSTFSTVYAYTDTLDIYIAEGSKSYFDYPRMDFFYTDLFEDGVSTPIFLCVEFIFTSSDTLDITVLNLETSVANLFYGSGSSPNNPIYPSAPGKDEVDGLGSAEHELIQSQQQGINAGLNVMGDTSTVLTDLNTSLQLGAFATQLSGILDKIVTIPGINALVQVSLALGLFASLMALSASIISAADRRAGKDARDTKQQERARTKSTHRRLGDF